MLSLPPAGGTGKKIDPAKLFGEDKYEKYASEIAADGTLDGERLTVDERKEGVRAYRRGKIDFEKFVNRVLKIKEEVSAPATGQARLTGSTFMPKALPQGQDLTPAPDDEDIPEGLDDLLNNLRTEQDELQAKLDESLTFNTTTITINNRTAINNDKCTVLDKDCNKDTMIHYTTK